MSSKGCVLDIRMRDKQGTNVTDYSRYGNDGAVNGDVVWTEQGMRFDGSTGYLDCGSGGSLNITDAITVSVWANSAGSTGLYQTILSKDGASMVLLVEPDRDITCKWLIDGNLVTFHSTTKIDYGVWSHLTFTCVGSTGEITLYKDAVDIGSAAIASGILDINTEDLTIAVRNDNIRYFNGPIADVQIYNRALTLQEIKARYDATKHRYK